MATETPHPSDIEVRRTADGGIEWSRPYFVAERNKALTARFWAIFNETPGGAFLRALRDAD